MEFPDKESLKTRYEEYSDDQLLDVLRNRSSYQEDAVKIATDIAIERTMINSEQDLISLEFKSTQFTSFSVFPSTKFRASNTKSIEEPISYFISSNSFSHNYRGVKIFRGKSNGCNYIWRNWSFLGFFSYWFRAQAR